MWCGEGRYSKATAPVGTFFQQAVNAVGFTAFLTGGERKYEIAGRSPTLFLEPNQVGDQFSVALFNIAGAATIKETVNLIELKRIQIVGPILLQRLYNVQVC